LLVAGENVQRRLGTSRARHVQAYGIQHFASYLGDFVIIFHRGRHEVGQRTVLPFGARANRFQKIGIESDRGSCLQLASQSISKA